MTTAIGPFSYTITIALLVDLLVAYNWTWEFIGDFSRFARTPRTDAAGPFAGANVAQTWWFTIGALGSNRRLRPAISRIRPLRRASRG